MWRCRELSIILSWVAHFLEEEKRVSNTTAGQICRRDTDKRSRGQRGGDNALGPEFKKDVQAKIWTPGPGSDTQEVLSMCWKEVRFRVLNNKSGLDNWVTGEFSDKNEISGRKQIGSREMGWWRTYELAVNASRIQKCQPGLRRKRCGWITRADSPRDPKAMTGTRDPFRG